MQVTISGKELAKAMLYAHNLGVEAKIAQWSAAGCADGIPGGAYDQTEIAECQRDAENAKAAYDAVKGLLSLLGLDTHTDVRQE